MFTIAIQATALALQAVAAILALRLIKITGRRAAWTFIACAVALIVARRWFQFAPMLQNPPAFTVGRLCESLLLLGISVLLVSGIALIAPLFAAQRRMQRDVREAHDFLSAVLDTAGALVIVIDRDGHTVRLNQTAERLTGYSLAEVKARPFWDVFLLPEETEAVRRVFSSLRAGQFPAEYENYWVTKDGRRRWIAWANTALVDDTGAVQFVIGTGIDMTERRQAEDDLRALNEELEERVQERMAQLRIANQELSRSNAELEQFAYVVSHDLQEPLRKIVSFGGRLDAVGGSELPDVGREYLGRMVDAATRMQALINDLLDYSRVTTRAQPFAQVDIAQVIREVLSDLEVSIEQTDARVEVGELPALEADPLQMRQLFQNLIGNALKFHRAGVAPVVEVSGHRLADTEAGPGLWCQFEVRDNGIGFEERFTDRIFGVFQRLHARGEYEGTGIGLAICRKITERHGGTITAMSQPDEGSTFIVTLPVMHEEGGR
jgi:PAS domain S-box-containing protein